MKLPESSKFQNWVVENETTGLTRDERGWHGFRARSGCGVSPQGPRHPHRRCGAEQVHRSLSSEPRRSKIAPSRRSTMVPKKPARMMIVTSSRQDKSREHRCGGNARSPKQSGNRPKQADASVGACGDRLENRDHPVLPGKAMPISLEDVSPAASASAASASTAMLGRHGNHQRGDSQIRHGLRRGASAGRLGGAELQLARMAHAGCNQSDGKDHQHARNMRRSRTAMMNATADPARAPLRFTPPANHASSAKPAVIASAVKNRRPPKGGNSE